MFFLNMVNNASMPSGHFRPMRSMGATGFDVEPALQVSSPIRTRCGSASRSFRSLWTHETIGKGRSRAKHLLWNHQEQEEIIRAEYPTAVARLTSRLPRGAIFAGSKAFRKYPTNPSGIYDGFRRKPAGPFCEAAIIVGTTQETSSGSATPCLKKDDF